MKRDSLDDPLAQCDLLRKDETVPLHRHVLLISVRAIVVMEYV